jgi:hypothetical protein
MDMGIGPIEIPNNRILNPMFTEELRSWSHSGDVTVTEWPMPLPSGAEDLFGHCVALGPGGELSQLLGFMPTQSDLWFGIQADDATPVDLTVTVKYTDRDMNVTETFQTKTRADFETMDGVLSAFSRIEVPLEDDTCIFYFTVANNAPVGDGIAPVYVGVFSLQVEYPEYGQVIDPRAMWMAFFARQLAEATPLPTESGSFWSLPYMNAMSPEGEILAAQIFALDRKLARLTKRLGLQDRKPGKPTHRKGEGRGSK